MDPTVYAIPMYFGSMGVEQALLRRRAKRLGVAPGDSPGDYEWRDTAASLTMGVGSLLAPLVVPHILGPLTPGKGRFGKVLVVTAAAAMATTVIADQLARLNPSTMTKPLDTSPSSTSDFIESPRTCRRHQVGRIARKVASIGAITTVAATGVAITSAVTAGMSSRTSKRFAGSNDAVAPSGADRAAGLATLAVATLGWDFIYYWNHRFMHSSRFMWAIHSVHHSSERYNLSTALRQPVADGLGIFAPYSALTLLGIRPEVITQARAINLLYQYWIHTDLIDRIGPFESILNSPSHHRVHHGVNPRYLDRNHGSILILWDRLFGTFERENEPVVYGLTTNIDTFNPALVATREYRDIGRDISSSPSWRQRLSFVLRGPGWSYEQHAAA
ncbi:MAG: sterol desaturase family protein [Actinomycetes bacterium]